VDDYDFRATVRRVVLPAPTAAVPGLARRHLPLAAAGESPAGVGLPSTVGSFGR
jgi:hypothetical protein